MACDTKLNPGENSMKLMVPLLLAAALGTVKPPLVGKIRQWYSRDDGKGATLSLTDDNGSGTGANGNVTARERTVDG